LKKNEEKMLEMVSLIRNHILSMDVLGGNIQKIVKKKNE